MFKMPEIEVIKFAAQDIVTTSTGSSNPNPDDGEIDWT